MSGKKGEVKLVAVGDVMFSSAGMFDPCRKILKGADVTFGQLEQVLSERGDIRPYSSIIAQSRPPLPGKPVPVRPAIAHVDPEECAGMLVDAGFNIMSFASNHTMHHGEKGMLDTLALMKKHNIKVIGAGKDISTAVKPAIIERNGTRIGFLAYCSVVIPGDEATASRGGVAPVRASTCYEQMDWQPGAPPKVRSKTYPDDLAGMVNDIRELRQQVDVLVVSMHWGVHFVPAYICEYQTEIGHAAIDAGADLILGHHTHILKGIEIYKDKVIFYSMCNFSSSAAGFSVGTLEKMKYSGTQWLSVFGYRFEVDPASPIYGYPAAAKKTILVKCDLAGNKIQRVAYVPLWINDRGEPEPILRTSPRFEEHYKWMEWMCNDQGLDTPLKKEGDEIVIPV